MTFSLRGILRNRVEKKGILVFGACSSKANIKTLFLCRVFKAASRFEASISPA